MAEILKHLGGTEEAEKAKGSPSGYVDMPTVKEDSKYEEALARLNAKNEREQRPCDAGSRWDVGTFTATYHCQRCSTTTVFPIGVYTAKPKPNCCIGPHVAFPY